MNIFLLLVTFSNNGNRDLYELKAHYYYVYYLYFIVVSGKCLNEMALSTAVNKHMLSSKIKPLS